MNHVPQRIPACAVEDLDDGDTMTVDGNGEAIAVHRVDGEFYATSDTCTHERWSLGEEGDLDGFEITCTLHNARFDVRDGKALCFPAVVNLRSYATVVEDGKVYVLTGEA
ncbi:non-heme iron oxygenase ferredoxin subunit [Amycolatopsis acidiphila]|uniref:Non-heme iron oxygenase ferredoxin subunit n=1 Tax=Amycolatopsis acidiphila TaxID=715473 RepID=A0A558AL81_9PSEU|nr:non-heme iron oxygenase ferredoxin subunit [Amycolatopsis acidiphila]TVT25022.1 non-heme iron oxygenase ferredoxin subunit [Amycolatopsis acidiphila]UIJ57469.1 non-heme iron oxygenase ferredoxin subunit [Amycolatopsis acidiphila]GHG96264.1 bifunctional 3-phenylpropionate/cinnamic acid dioxygenase ferredoxin subunit [Amycolatopsis acidiphila]